MFLNLKARTNDTTSTAVPIKITIDLKLVILYWLVTGDGEALKKLQLNLRRFLVLLYQFIAHAIHN